MGHLRWDFFPKTVNGQNTAYFRKKKSSNVDVLLGSK